MKKFLIVFTALTSLSGILGLNTSYAADSTTSPNASVNTSLKIGVLDMQQVLQKSTKVAQLNQQLKEKFKTRQDKIVSTRKNIQTEMADFSKNQAVMKDADKEKLKNKILSEQNAYETLVQSFQKDVNSFQSEGMQKFMGALENTVNTIAKAGRYTLILNRTAVPYTDPNNDVTQQVLDKLNQS